MPKKRSKPKEPERIEIIEAAREESDDEEAQQPQKLPADAAHADFVKVWSAKMSELYSTRGGKTSLCTPLLYPTSHARHR